jgi:transcriptional regulator with XRE-family HTH domain
MKISKLIKDPLMNDSSANANTLGQLIRQGRATKELSIRDLAESADVPRSTLLDLELGRVASPHPATLQSLANTLELPLADVYAAAGYAEAQGLPSFAPYLRSKYRDLPPDARAELAHSFQIITKKYGYDTTGPAPGADEN